MTSGPSIPGFVDYQRREFCRDVKCPRQLELEQTVSGSAAHARIRELCRTGCLYTTYEFHHWLMEKGYLIVRPERE